MIARTSILAACFVFATGISLADGPSANRIMLAKLPNGKRAEEFVITGIAAPTSDDTVDVYVYSSPTGTKPAQVLKAVARRATDQGVIFASITLDSSALPEDNARCWIDVQNQSGSLLDERIVVNAVVHSAPATPPTTNPVSSPSASSQPAQGAQNNPGAGGTGPQAGQTSHLARHLGAGHSGGNTLPAKNVDALIDAALPPVSPSFPILKIDLRSAHPQLTLIKQGPLLPSNRLRLDSTTTNDVASIQLVAGKRIRVALILPSTDSSGAPIDDSNFKFLVQLQPASSTPPASTASLALTSDNQIALSDKSVALFVVDDDSLTVPTSGSVNCSVTNSGTLVPGSSATITAATPWKFDNSFSPMVVWQGGSSFQFGVAQPVYTFGNNASLRIDGVATFPVTDPTTGDANGITLGQALSYNFYVGGTTHETGRQVFGFPLRMGFWLGYNDLDFGKHGYPGHLFLGYGISIPIGN